MKNIHLIIYGLILVLSILCLLSLQKKTKNDNENVFVIYSPSNSKNSNMKSGCFEEFDQIVQDLQPKYRLGYNGTYEPAPICNQPLDALPFNPGLQPCTEIIPV